MAATSIGTRHCSRCSREKSIQGVWYLTPQNHAAMFVCESCFHAAPMMRAA